MLTSPSKLDIGHVVPLKGARFSGARTWTPVKRKQFHNDVARPQTLAVSSASNRSKGDKASEEWMPPRLAYHWPRASAPLERPSPAFYRAPQMLPLARIRSHLCSSAIRPAPGVGLRHGATGTAALAWARTLTCATKGRGACQPQGRSGRHRPPRAVKGLLCLLSGDTRPPAGAW